MAQSIIVIGAGIIGAATAWQLAKAGHQVQIVDSGAAGATDASFGWINASFFLDTHHHQLRAQGIAAWHRALRALPLPVDWQGCLCWDMDAPKIEATFANLRAQGYPVELLSRAEVLAREPNVKGLPDQTLFFPSEGAASSRELAQVFVSAACAMGAKVIGGLSVTALKTRGHRVVGIATTHGEMLADQVVIAAGTGTSALAQTIDCEIPLVPRPAYIMRTAPQPKLLHHTLATPAGEIRQEPSGKILMPAAVNHQADSAETLTQSPSAAADDAMRRLRDVCAGLEGASWSEVTCATRPVPAGGLPVVGAIAQGAYVAVLHSGITLGPIVAELAAKEIAGRLTNTESATLAPYRPDRFLGA